MKLHKVVTDNMCKLSMGQMHKICKRHRSIQWYHTTQRPMEWQSKPLVYLPMLFEPCSTILAYLNLWAEACSTAAYICNRTSSKSLNRLTPYEQLYSEKPNVSHLHAFVHLALSLSQRNT